MKNCFTEEDYKFMSRAIELAKQGRFTTTPNPNVGCVIVKNGDIVGEGFHSKAGEPHAEINALSMAGNKAKGATAYVTLEPCSHVGKTPPCANALKAAGIKKVISSMIDPHPKVSGQGLKFLEREGVLTQTGLLEQESRALNLGFLKRIETGYPYVTCKLGASIDGKTALKNGESKWITSEESRRDVQTFRALHSAIMTGADTVIQDDARLNVRANEMEIYPLGMDGLRQPVRIVIDGQNRLTKDLTMFSIEAPIILLRSQPDLSNSWPSFVTQVEVPTNPKNGKLDLKTALSILATKGIDSIWLEAGQTLSGQFVQSRLIDEFIFYLAPTLMGHEAKSLVKLPEVKNLSESFYLKYKEVESIGKDLRIRAIPL